MVIIMQVESALARRAQRALARLQRVRMLP
jgi:hypothetical protein